LHVERDHFFARILVLLHVGLAERRPSEKRSLRHSDLLSNRTANICATSR
jgi:hypothetical protein